MPPCTGGLPWNGDTMLVVRMVDTSAGPRVAVIDLGVGRVRQSGPPARFRSFEMIDGASFRLAASICDAHFMTVSTGYDNVPFDRASVSMPSFCTMAMF